MSGRSNRGLSAIARVKMGAVLSSRYYVNMNGRIQMGRVKIYIVILSKKGFRPPPPWQTKIPPPLGKMFWIHTCCVICVYMSMQNFYLLLYLFVPTPNHRWKLMVYSKLLHMRLSNSSQSDDAFGGGGGNIYN